MHSSLRLATGIRYFCMFWAMAAFKALNGDCLNSRFRRTCVNLLLSEFMSLAWPLCFWGFGALVGLAVLFTYCSSCGAAFVSRRLSNKSSILGLSCSFSFLFLLLNALLETPFSKLNVCFAKIFSLKLDDLVCCFSFLEVFSNFNNGFSWKGSLPCLNSAILLEMLLLADLALSPLFLIA